MASVPPPATSAQPPPLRESSQPATPLSWEGEKMFNIYIYDYCFKRGFRKTARELLVEAEIPPEATPPINARQGLLFEWWSVFWVLFQAKSNGGGSEDALLYTQQQQQQVRGRNIQAAPVAGQPPQPPIQRQNQLPPGVMNGMTAGISGQHQLPPGPTPMNFAMGGAPTPQPNGIAASHPPTPGSAPNQPQQLPHGPQQPNFNPNSMLQQQGPRPASMNGPPQHPNGQQQQQRPIGTPSNSLPFQSPTMAHSPNVQQQGPQNQQQMGATPVGNMTGPSPLLRGGMIPNGMQQTMGMGPQQPGGHPGGPQFNQMAAGRPPSRTTTPQMQPGMMVQSSPSLANRPLAMGQSNAADFAITNDLLKMPPQQLQQAKAEVRIPQDKDIHSLNINEKRTLLEFCQRRFPKPATAAGTSPMMQPPPNLQQRPPQQLQQQQQQQARSIKRNSTSPGEEPDNMPSGSSPPDRKRLRRSPENAPMVPKGATPMPYPIPPPGQQQGHPPQLPPGHPQQQPPPNMIMRGGPMPQMINGQHMMMQGQPGPQGPPGMGGMQGGQMGPPTGGMVQNQIGSNYHRVPLHQAHAHAAGGAMQGQTNAGSPAGPSDPSFNPGGPNPGGPPGPGGTQFNPGPNRMLDPKAPQGRVVPPPAGSMMPPPSPANNAKDAQKDGKASPRTMGQPHGQPLGQSIPPPSGPGGNQQAPHPGTPGPPDHPQQPPQQQQQQQVGNQPPPGAGGPPGMPGMTSSPAGNLMNGLMAADSMLFSADFADFSFNGESIDFERDFGQWFNGQATDDIATLDMK